MHFFKELGLVNLTHYGYSVMYLNKISQLTLQEKKRALYKTGKLAVAM